ncbi:MAG: hypothetical protein U9R32_09760 [Bacteroidota bacterium]|nr:hypothetical protein [Bacteroidota bacterium]
MNRLYTIFLLLFISMLLTITANSQNTVYNNTEYNNFVTPSLRNFFDIYDTTQHQGNYINRKLFNEHFITVNEKDFTLIVDPLMNFTLAKSNKKDDLLYRNTRAAIVAGRIGKTVSFYSAFYETQLTAPQYIDDYVKSYGVLPGHTNPKKFGDGGYDFGAVYGGVAWQIKKGSPITFRLAFDEMFIGKGYRSLFLSNNGFPYYFVSTQYDKKKFFYLFSLASMQNPNFRNVMELQSSSINTSAFHKKTVAFHYLGYRPNKNISVGLFQATLFQVADSSSATFRAEWLNPIILAAPVCYGMEGSNNVLLGAEFSLAYHYVQFYSQLVIDDFGINNSLAEQEIGCQIGAHYSSNLLHLNIEYNRVNKGVYSHTNPLQSYTNFNQPLAFQSGQNIKELIFQIEYQYKKFYTEIVIINQKKQTTSLENVFKPQVISLSGDANDVTAVRGELHWIINPKTNLSFFTGAQKNYSTTNEEYLYLGLKTSLRKISWDVFK